MVRVAITYTGRLHCCAIHGPSGQEIQTDAPVDNQGKGECFSPTDLVATALGSCMATIMGIVARRHGLNLEGMLVEVEKAMTPAAPRRIARLAVQIHVPLPPDCPQRETLENAALACPVHHSLHPEIEKPVRFHWVGR
ncbi:MAG: OsmC family protein [Verrucomicrobiae bacterium]|nr:OsmC family protein [Verrucomicrobiae bacterium]